MWVIDYSKDTWDVIQKKSKASGIVGIVRDYYKLSNNKLERRASYKALLNTYQAEKITLQKLLEEGYVPDEVYDEIIFKMDKILERRKNLRPYEELERENPVIVPWPFCETLDLTDPEIRKVFEVDPKTGMYIRGGAKAVGHLSKD